MKIRSALEYKINVLYILQSEIIGGAEIALLNIIQRLDRKRFNPFILLGSKKKVYSFFSNRGFSVKVISPHNPPIIYKDRFLELVEKNRIKIIHTNTPSIFSGAIIAKHLKIPHLWHLHANLSDIYPNLKKKEIKKILSLMYILSNKIITVSNYVRRQLEFIKDKHDKIQIIYNGIDIDYFNSNKGLDFRKRYKIKRDDLVISMFSRFDPLKRHEDFIKAARYIKKDISNAKFFLVGDDNPNYFKNRLLNLIRRNNLERDFIFTGYLSDIRPVLNVTDIVVLPSISEGFSMSLLEATASKVPVVTTGSGGNPEVVLNGKTGILVPPKNPYRLAQPIIQLLKDPQKRKEMGEAGRKRVEKFFNISNTTRQTEKLYKSLI